MSEPRNPDEAPETGAGLQGSGDVSASYRRASGEEPPPHLDDAILAASRRAVQAGPGAAGRRPPRAWLRPLSVAAVIVLGVTVTLSIYRNTSYDMVPAPAGPDMLSIDALPGGKESGSDEYMAIPHVDGKASEAGEVASGSSAANRDAVFARKVEEPLPAAAGPGAQPEYPAAARAGPDTAPAMKRMLKRETLHDLAPLQGEPKKEAAAPVEEVMMQSRVAAAADMAASDELAEIAGLWRTGREAEAVDALRAYLERHPGNGIAELESALPRELISRALAKPAP